MRLYSLLAADNNFSCIHFEYNSPYWAIASAIRSLPSGAKSFNWVVALTSSFCSFCSFFLFYICIKLEQDIRRCVILHTTLFLNFQVEIFAPLYYKV